jgi:putative membrane protein insertion efficiency factor
MFAPHAARTFSLARLPQAAILAGIKIYQLSISQLFTGSCRFLPSCSSYAAEAVARHGSLKGSVLAIRRLARCHPFCAGGHDPVP